MLWSYARLSSVHSLFRCNSVWIVTLTQCCSGKWFSLEQIRSLFILVRLLNILLPLISFVRFFTCRNHYCCNQFSIQISRLGSDVNSGFWYLYRATITVESKALILISSLKCNLWVPGKMCSWLLDTFIKVRPFALHIDFTDLGMMSGSMDWIFVFAEYDLPVLNWIS